VKLLLELTEGSLIGSLPELQAPLDALYPPTQVSDFVRARGVNGVKSREVLIDSRQTRLDTRKPQAHLPLDVIELSVYPPQHFLG
jgi:hypothetical protein